jgi:hypothetical protein
VGGWLLTGTYEEGYQSGYEDGYEAGYDDGHDTGHQAGYDEGYDIGYDLGYQAGLDYSSPIISDLQEQIEGLIATYADTTPPTGSIQAHDNCLFPPNNTVVEVTLSGCVCDELSIARDGGGTGISSAYLLVNGEETIPLVLDSDGLFSLTKEFEARKDTIYTIELYASDTNPIENGGPNSGLIDQTYIHVPSDRGQRGSK